MPRPILEFNDLVFNPVTGESGHCLTQECSFADEHDEAHAHLQKSWNVPNP